MKTILVSSFAAVDSINMPGPFFELCEIDPVLKSIWEEANRPQYRQDPNFCRDQLWGATPRESGKFGLKTLLAQRQTIWLNDDRFKALRTEEAWNVACSAIKQAMPPCAHAPGAYHKEGDIEWQDQTCTSQYPLEVSEKVKDGKAISTNRLEGRGFKSVTAMLEEASGGEPAVPIAVKPINDAAEPVYIVRNTDDARRLALMVHLKERFEDGGISAWYLKNAIYVCDDEARQEILPRRFNKEQLTGALSWKPVVLTFKDAALERKLSEICVQVVTVIGTKKSGDEYSTVTLDEVHDALKPLVSAADVGIKDMPEEVLDGWLGDVCRTRMAAFPRAYAWPALLTAASVLVPRLPNGRSRANLYVALSGPKGSGKSSAFSYAFKLLNIQKPVLLSLKSGSAEGMAQLIGDVGGDPRLFYTDELAHLLIKAGIENSTFAQNLSTAYYEDEQLMTIAHGREINFNCRLTLAGGIVEESFDELFGAATTLGFYDRFTFGQCPTGYSYMYRPFEGAPALAQPRDDNAFLTHNPWQEQPARPVAVEIDQSVWEVRDSWAVEHNIPGRVSEHAIRAAIICAAFDGRSVLKGRDLTPAFALARYQNNIRKILAPNPGKNTDAVVAYKMLSYLRSRAQNGEWVNRRTMLHSVRVYDFGPGAADRALAALEFNGEIEQGKAGRQRVVRLNLDRV